MNKEELKQLIDTEVSKVFSDMASKEPAKEMEESKDVSVVYKRNAGGVGLIQPE